MGKIEYSVIVLLVICSCLCVSGEEVGVNMEYSDEKSLEYFYITELAYCSIDRVKRWDIGKLLEPLKEWRLLYCVSHKTVQTDYEISSMVIIANDKEKLISVAFRGSSHKQIVDEVVYSGDVPYLLHPIPDAVALEYFYTNYDQLFRQDLINHLQFYQKEMPQYSYLFTGHSLGGAITVLAALDLYLLNLMDQPPLVYTYGQPRVSNPTLSLLFNEKIPFFYRVVHNRDLVPHVPPCMGLSFCKLEEVEENGYLWDPWHSGREVWYNDEMTSYVLCSSETSEDPECSNSRIFNLSTEDHNSYFKNR
jgi:hypothetical protein